MNVAELSQTESVVLTHKPITPMDVIERAYSQGVPVEQMIQLFELKLRVEADEARKAFNKAFAEFKAEAVQIAKNVTVTDGPLKGKKYADLFGVVDAIVPALSRHQLSHSWKITKDEQTWMEVTCTIRHADGHQEAVSMGAAPDAGPGRNAIQARASAKSYLERYTLLAATGLAAGSTDDDGASAGAPEGGMPAEHRDEWLDAIRTASREELNKRFGDAFKVAQRMNDAKALLAFTNAKDKRKAELDGAR